MTPPVDPGPAVEARSRERGGKGTPAKDPAREPTDRASPRRQTAQSRPRAQSIMKYNRENACLARFMQCLLWIPQFPPRSTLATE
jgi:hypothetical protein